MVLIARLGYTNRFKLNLCLISGRKPTPTVYIDDADENGSIIPVYCAVLGLVIIGLVGYVIFTHYRRMRTKRRHKAPCTHEDVEYAKASEVDSGVFIENDSSQCYTCKYVHVENLLSPCN